MSGVALLLIAVGLSMDAFAVSLCKGLSLKRLSYAKALLIGAWFGSFQALMPLLGYGLGMYFAAYVAAVGHWIAFALLFAVGLKMLWESCGARQEGNASLGIATMLPLALATSMDAFAVGITLALLPAVHILAAVGFIGLTTFLLSVLAVGIGHMLNLRWGRFAERAGGILLILIALKILLDHLL